MFPFDDVIMGDQMLILTEHGWPTKTRTQRNLDHLSIILICFRIRFTTISFLIMLITFCAAMIFSFQYVQVCYTGTEPIAILL